MSGRLSADEANSTDGEGVWSPDIEQAFQEALLIYLPCGRRKHIIQEEGNASKMYGRNELIARHIKMRTGKTRTRKQVSSHIQVLARRKAKLEPGTHSAHQPQQPPDEPLAPLHQHQQNHQLHQPQQQQQQTIPSQLQLAQTAHMQQELPNQHHHHHLANNGFNQRHNLHHHHHHHHNGFHYPYGHLHHHRPSASDGTPSPESAGQLSRPESDSGSASNLAKRYEEDAQLMHQPTNNEQYDYWMDRPIATQRIRLVEFSAFIEYRNLKSNTLPNTPFPSSPHHLNQQQLTSHHFNQAHNNNNTLNNHNNHHHTLPQTHPIASDQSAIELNASGAQATAGLTYQLPAGLASVSPDNQPAGEPNIHGASLYIQTCAGAHLDRSQQAAPPNETPISNSAVQQASNTRQDLPVSASNQTRPLVRHCCVQIDYTSPLERESSKRLEQIDILQIQDKFPKLGGPDGMFARGPSDAFFLIKFWADLTSSDLEHIDDQSSYFGFSSHFEMINPYRDITCSTKACSYGAQVVEKVDKIRPVYNTINGSHSYTIDRSPMCEFMIQFIRQLRKLKHASYMNSVLENFTVLQVITSESTGEVLLCLAYVFEVALANLEGCSAGPQYHVYKLTKD